MRSCFLISYCMILLHSVTAPTPITESDIINQCRTTIKVLPIYNAYKDFYQQLVHRDNLQEYNITQVRANLFVLCKSRYIELIRYGARNNELLMTNDRNNNTLKKRNLLVLDLDESSVPSVSAHIHCLFIFEI